MKIPPAGHAVTIVLTGNLNPAIISPQWLARHHAISGEAADAAEISIIHPEVSTFKCGWCVVHVTRDRFQVQTSETPFIRLSDLVTKTFGELLPSTPLRALGINVTISFGAPSAKARNDFGLALCPPENWSQWGRDIAERVRNANSKESHGGLVSVTMQQRPMDDRESGWLNVKVDPTDTLPDGTGISVEVNDHYVIGESHDKKSDGLSYAQLLSKRFEKSIERSESIIDQLMGLVHV
jgi:hypothetical protein